MSRREPSRLNSGPAGDPSPFSRVVRRPVAFLGRLGRVVLDAGQRFFSDHCQLHAAGIAYRVLFSIAPLAIVLVSIFGLVLQNDEVRQNVVDTIVSALPVSLTGRKDVENAITAIATPASAIGLVSILLFAWAATGMMGAIRQGLESAMGVTESRPMARGKFVDLLLIVGAPVLVLAIAGPHRRRRARTAGAAAPRHLDRPRHRHARTRPPARRGVPPHVGVVLLLYRFVPARGLRFRDGLVGAVVTAVLLQLISFASAVIYDKTTRLSVVYGSLTAALVFLYSVYLYSSALLLGAEVAAAWSRPPGPPGPPAWTQLKRLLLGFFIKQQPARAGKRCPPEPRTG